MPRPGQVLGLVGSNGTGKSTALKILAGKLKPNLGRFDVSASSGWLPALCLLGGCRRSLRLHCTAPAEGPGGLPWCVWHGRWPARHPRFLFYVARLLLLAVYLPGAKGARQVLCATASLPPAGCCRTSAVPYRPPPNPHSPRRAQSPPDWSEILTYFRGSELQNYFQRVLEDNVKAIIKPQYVDHIPKVPAPPAARSKRPTVI